MINISGIVGFTLLKYNNNKEDLYLLLCADIHDGVSYCKDNGFMIAEFLNSKSKNNIILLEELLNTESKINVKALWPNSKHTQELKYLKDDNDRVIPVDIRPYLVPFSWELMRDNNKLGDITLGNYLLPLENFFNKSSNFYLSLIKDKVQLMKEIQSRQTGSKLSPQVHFNEINSLFEDFKKEQKELMNTMIIKLSHKLLERINNLISLIMEWYIILLIHNNSKNIIIHCGLVHNERILNLLTKVYRFVIIKENGINRVGDLPDSMPSACVMLPNDVIKMFDTKYGYNML